MRVGGAKRVIGQLTYRHALALAHLGRSHAVGGQAAVLAAVVLSHSFELLRETKRLTCRSSGRANKKKEPPASVLEPDSPPATKPESALSRTPKTRVLLSRRSFCRQSPLTSSPYLQEHTHQYSRAGVDEIRGVGMP